MYFGCNHHPFLKFIINLLFLIPNCYNSFPLTLMYLDSQQTNIPLSNMDWITLYDYINIKSKVSISIKVNNFFQSFYPLKYKSSQRKDVQFKTYPKQGFLGGVGIAISKILYSFQLFLASELEICPDEDKSMKDIIRLSQIAIEIQEHYLEDSMRVEPIMNMVIEIAEEMTKTPKDSKTFLEVKVMAILYRFHQFFVWFHTSYQGDEKALNKMFDLLHRIIINVKNRYLNEINYYKEIKTIVEELLKFLESKNSVKFDGDFIRSLESIFFKQKKIISWLVETPMIKALEFLGEKVPKEIMDSYSRSEAEINNLVSEEEQDVDPLLIAERIRNSNQWKNIVHQQMVNLTVDKLIKNPSKILTIEEYKRSSAFPLFQIP